jgi:hypothetical protein
MPNKEQRFYKKHPIISMVLAAVGAGLLVFLFTKPFFSNQPSISQVISGNNNQVITEYTLSNKSSLPALGKALVSPQGGEIDSVMIIEGQGKVIQLPDKTWAVQFNVPKDQDLKFRIASGSTANVGISINLDSSFLRRLEKYFNLSGSSK